MGRLSTLVQRAVASRREFMSLSATGGSSGTRHVIAPLLQGDFRLTFVDGNDSSLQWHSTDFLLTSLSGPSATLSWSPHSSILGVSMPSISQDYLTINFYVSGDPDYTRASFPSLFLYNDQFAPNGALRLPSSEYFASPSSTGGRFRDSTLAFEDEINSEFGDLGRPFVRPTIILYALYRPSAGGSSMEDTPIELCRFEGCVFGTPTPAVNPSAVVPMTWSQQIGYRFVVWQDSTFLGKAISKVENLRSFHVTSSN